MNHTYVLNGIMVNESEVSDYIVKHLQSTPIGTSLCINLKLGKLQNSKGKIVSNIKKLKEEYRDKDIKISIKHENLFKRLFNSSSISITIETKFNNNWLTIAEIIQAISNDTKFKISKQK